MGKVWISCPKGKSVSLFKYRMVRGAISVVKFILPWKRARASIKSNRTFISRHSWAWDSLLYSRFVILLNSVQHAVFNLEGGLCVIKTISTSLSLELVSVLLLGDFQAQTSQRCNWKSHFHTTKCMLVRWPSKSQTMSLVIIAKKKPFFDRNTQEEQNTRVLQELLKSKKSYFR